PELVAGFLAAHPLVQLDMTLVNRRVDLVAEGIDVALRVRELGDEDPLLVTKRLRQAHTVLVASPVFMRERRVETLEDLKQLPILGALEADRMVHQRIIDPQGNMHELVMEARLGIEDFIVRKASAMMGVGFTVLPMMYCEEELASGRLVQLLPQWSLPGGWLQAVYPHRRGVLPAIRAWIDYLEEGFKGCGDRLL
ncbi:MAG: LysR substrate-binding domain-containing protein, partial [Pseudomonas paracarnis]